MDRQALEVSIYKPLQQTFAFLLQKLSATAAKPFLIYTTLFVCTFLFDCLPAFILGKTLFSDDGDFFQEAIEAAFCLFYLLSVLLLWFGVSTDGGHFYVKSRELS